MAGVAHDDGWTTFSPPDEELLTRRIAGALESAEHDCRLFAKLARDAQLDRLPDYFKVTWEQFCQERLRKPSREVEAMIAGVEALGEDIPVPQSVALRVGNAVLDRLKAAPALPGHGEVGNSRSRVDIVKSTIGGNSQSYLAARLKRDLDNPEKIAPEVSARIKAGEFTSVRAAAVAAGIVKVKTPLQQVQYLWPKLTADERLAFLQWAKTEIR